MAIKGPSIKDVNQNDFQEAVLEESYRRPVVVDFWASWCGPCRTLDPILEKLAAEFQGDFLLVKVDTEANQELAHSFQIRSIPNVKVFRDGSIVDEMIGAYPEEEVRAFLRRHCPSPIDRKYNEAMLQLTKGRKGRARQLLTEVLELDATHFGALVELGKVLVSEDQFEDAERLWDRVPMGSPLWGQAQTLKQALHFQLICTANGGLPATATLVEAKPESLDAHYAHACCLAASGDFQSALEEFLFIVARDKNFNDQAARKAMLTVFSLVGERSELAEEYRKRLALVLF